LSSDNDVARRRPVGIARTPWPGDEGRIGGESCPVAERASKRSSGQASASVGITLSIDASTMCTLGSVMVRSALPSLVTTIADPVSATRKLAPVIPTSAARNFSRRTPRASATRVSGLGKIARGVEVTVVAAELFGDILGAQMNGRRDDVARPLVTDLDEVFAEVRLDHVEGRFLQPLTQCDLLETIDLLW
jgi:hypothetical protein